MSNQDDKYSLEIIINKCLPAPRYSLSSVSLPILSKPNFLSSSLSLSPFLLLGPKCRIYGFWGIGGHFESFLEETENKYIKRIHKIFKQMPFENVGLGSEEEGRYTEVVVSSTC